MESFVRCWMPCEGQTEGPRWLYPASVMAPQTAPRPPSCMRHRDSAADAKCASHYPWRQSKRLQAAAPPRYPHCERTQHSAAAFCHSACQHGSRMPHVPHTCVRHMSHIACCAAGLMGCLFGPVVRLRLEQSGGSSCIPHMPASTQALHSLGGRVDLPLCARCCMQLRMPAFRREHERTVLASAHAAASLSCHSRKAAAKHYLACVAGGN